MKSKPRGPYAKTALVRKGIRDAAVTAFAESGYRATTMKEIAVRAGISERGLAHHYPSKGELLLELLTVLEEESTPLVTSGDAIDQISGIIAVARYNIERPQLLELQNILGAEAASPSHPAHQRLTARYDELRQHLTALFGQLRDQSRLHTDLTPETLAAMYIALVDGLQMQWLYNRNAVDVERTLGTFLDSVCGLKLPDAVAKK